MADTHAPSQPAIDLGDLARLLGVGPVEGAGSVRVERVVTDSRRVTPPSLFVALRGSARDGADFADDAARRGAVGVVSERDVETALPVLVVPDARLASRRAAWALWGGTVAGLRLVGVTGTNGKTTVTWLVRDMLATAGRAGLVSTLGVDAGRGLEPTGFTTPETAELLDAIGRAAVAGARSSAVEVSSHSLALGRVAGLRFDAAVFTNLTREHLDFHKSMEGYLDAKAALFEGLAPEATAVLNAADPASKELARRTRAKVVLTGLDEPANVRVELLRKGPLERVVRLAAPEGAVELAWSLAGTHNLENLASAAGAGLAMGIGLDAIAGAASRFRGVPGRLERVEAGQAFDVLVDFAHTPAALERLLRSVRPETRGRLICVFGCGGDRDRTKRAPMGRVVEELADVVVVTSDNPRSEDPEAIIAEVLGGLARPDAAIVRADRREAIEAAISLARPGDTVVLAGKGHETEQIVGSDRMPFDDREVAREVLARSVER